MRPNCLVKEMVTGNKNEKMKKLTFWLLFGSAAISNQCCKPTYILADDNKSIAQNITAEETAVKLSTIIDGDRTGAAVGIKEIFPGGLTRVTKDSITYYQTIGPQLDKSSNGFASGYESTPNYKESSDVVISVKFDRVKSIKISEPKEGDLRINFKDDHTFLPYKPRYQCYTSVANRDLAIALCSVLMPQAKIVYSGD